jgi:tripartite ATP-independent transporter DctP family solute receptor
MKRLISLLMALAMTAAILTGCGVVTTKPTEGTGAGSAGSSSGASTTTSDNTSTPAQPLEGASLVLKMSHGDNDTSMLENTWNCYARVFKKSLELYSGGEITLDIYPNDQLGSTTSCLEQCSQGSLDIALSASVGALAGWIPNASVFDIPYLIGDMDVCNLVCQGEVLNDLSTGLQKTAHMRLLSMMQTDFRNLDTWKAPVHTVSDLKGLKMRVQEIDPHIAMVKAWGAVPTTVAFTELYSAASTGVIDCFENCNYTLFMNNLYETVKYITETKHVANVCICAMNEQSWEKLTPEQQDIITRATADARRATIGVVAASNVNRINELESDGIQIISLTDDERAEFKNACFESAKASAMKKIDADFYNKFVEEYDAAAKIMGKT